jgi:glucokinase
MNYIIGVDLGGTYMRAIATDRMGHIYRQVQTTTRTPEGPMVVIDQIVTMIEQVRAALPDHDDILGVGVGAPGPLDPEAGVVFFAPNMPGWHNVPLRAILAERTGLRVELNNDANVAALGEWMFGGGRDYRHIVYITVSTGIGAGAIIDGRLLLGRMGAGAELGYMLIDQEHFTPWEKLASGTAMAAAAAAAMQAEPGTLLHQLATPATVTAADVAVAARQGDPLARRLMQREATLLGIGFVNTLHIFSPDILLVGGGVVLANPWLLEGARQVVQQHALGDIYRAVPIEVAHLGSQVGVMGAIALVLYQHIA